MADTETPRLPKRDRSLVTGATGLLGGNIVRLLLGLDQEVVALVRDMERARRLLPDDPRLHLVRGDVTEPSTYRGHLTGVDEVFHTAAYFREYFQDPTLTAPLERINVQGTEQVLSAAATSGVPVFLHTGSINTMALRGPERPADESTPPPEKYARPAVSDTYPTSKVRADRAVAAMVRSGRTGDTRVATVLPGWMWGPGDAGPTSAGRLFLDVAKGRVRAIPRLHNYVVDARDVAYACVAAARVGTADRYVVAGEKRSLPALTDTVAAETGARAPRSVPAGLATAAAALMELSARLRGGEPTATREGVRVLREGDARNISSDLARRELGVGFRPVAETVTAMGAWYRTHGMLPAGQARAGSVR
ncbi:NAD-dependent epimerase/dehydratase family protein [Nocardiopsis changdeensis]|uniref:NAD-dependent epimerase/dehydratase family protein n=1 Tax=Nocardiopsis changdeensis TaxID=2831969 RepID=A0ABX8BWQ3_9ACTN|nr:MULTISPECIES: NAD-dependent epimerase/dehydratase family protein [Nocardiopsis]QUX24773.1 NAD-dependent epimerase/dehydratase family protein [Nocardiopsis changdeensis]QYX35160.1 NAD-dependent epimerase/dehydratase family protein [Nocardiopsis sp. MT53]